ncbi:MAG: 50S ribosomal protein L6 [Myxococcota bacterium]|jgi:large subunit ribosomal protein L6|nr:50S ribosomal protein L6 [Myxococcota bacterium]
MSRIGKKPIAIPQGVNISLSGQKVTVKGPKGTLTRELPSEVKVELADNNLHVSPAGEGRRFAAFHGLSRALVANMVSGVSVGFQKNMQIIGVGYRVALDGKKLVFTLGYSHPVVFPLPEGITAEVGDKGLSFVVRGYDRELLGHVCATIRGYRPPEPYKGKGVRYVKEVVRQKAGKAGSK